MSESVIFLFLLFLLTTRIHFQHVTQLLKALQTLNPILRSRLSHRKNVHREIRSFLMILIFHSIRHPKKIKVILTGLQKKIRTENPLEFASSKLDIAFAEARVILRSSKRGGLM